MSKTIYRPHAAPEFEAETLKDCPFCGGVAELTFVGNPYTKSRKVNIKCKGCRVQLTNGGVRWDHEKIARVAIAAWNNREISEAINFAEYALGMHLDNSPTKDEITKQFKRWKNEQDSNT